MPLDGSDSDSVGPFTLSEGDGEEGVSACVPGLVGCLVERRVGAGGAVVFGVPAVLREGVPPGFQGGFALVFGRA